MIHKERMKRSFEKVKSEMEFLKEKINSLERSDTAPFTLWLTGLPCSGKTTIAKKLESQLGEKGYHIAHLDGDDVRRGINADLGFSKKDREENLRRAGHIAQLLNDKGMIVIASFVSPLEENRKFLKSIIKNFNLVFVKCSVNECSRRDVKGMYALAKKDEIKNFTGISAPFEEPADAEMILETENLEVDECVEEILKAYF